MITNYLDGLYEDIISLPPLQDETGLPPFFLFGAEIEFYIDTEETIDEESPLFKEIEQLIISNSSSNANHNWGFIQKMEKERGRNQFEIQLFPHESVSELADNIVMLKQTLQQTFHQINFQGKPHENLPGNGLHFHISLYNSAEDNLLLNPPDIKLFSPESPYYNFPYSMIMYDLIGGMIKYAMPAVYTFNQSQNCYERYKTHNKIWIENPTRCCWGINNRTCAIRIPQPLNMKPIDTRIEHRLPSAACNPHFALASILFAIREGILHAIEPPLPIFGNAFDEQYNHLPYLPLTEEEARKYFLESPLGKELGSLLINNQ